MKGRSIGFRRRWFILAVVAVGLVSTLAFRNLAFGHPRNEVGPAHRVTGASNESSSAMIADAQADLAIETLVWVGDTRRGDARLVLDPDQPSHLGECGSDAYPGSFLILADHDVAYCIHGVDPSDLEQVNAAIILGRQLITGATYSEAQLEVLRLQTLLGYAKLESPEAAGYRDDLIKAWDALSPSERMELKD